ncbi:hypothetical protein [Streptacidiphilus sp. PAMC 29251]
MLTYGLDGTKEAIGFGRNGNRMVPNPYRSPPALTEAPLARTNPFTRPPACGEAALSC